MSAGWIPTPVRNVKTFVAVVQPGDSVSRIAQRMTGSPSRWPELVGANLHKPLSPGNVAGSPYRVFSSLQAGEHLMVPASWPNPGQGVIGKSFPGGYINETKQQQVQLKEQAVPPVPCNPKTCAQLGASCGIVNDECGANIDCGGCKDGEQCGAVVPHQCGVPFDQGPTNDPYGALITTIVGTVIPGMVPPGTLPTPPPTFGMPDIAKIISAWYPYLPPGILPKTPVIPNPGDGSVSMWLKLIESAIAFLTAAGLSESQIDWLAKIPWDSNMPWSKIPWQQLIVALDPLARLPIWNLLIGAATGGGIVNDKPSMNAATSGGDFVFNPFDPTIWTRAPFSNVNAFGWENFLPAAAGIQDMPGTWGKIDDMELLGCIAGNPKRAAELADPKYVACFKTDMTKLKLYMCNPQLNAADCAKTIDPKNPPVPIVPPGINWACQPSPKCIADQLGGLPGGVPAGMCPPPGTAYPACIPEWYKTITGQNVPPPPAEEKKDSNLPLYLGLGAAGIALVAGILVIAAAD